MTLRVDVITLFPEALANYATTSVLGRASERGVWELHLHDVRDVTDDPHRTVDDTPYGGGAGMVMRAEPVLKAVESITKKINKRSKAKIKIILFSPAGKKFTTEYAKNSVKKYTDIIMISGRYEGIDSRVQKILKAEEISIGDYVLTGGELPAMVLVDCMARQIKGVLGRFESLEEERISSSEFYTRPEVFEYKGKKYKVPKVLLSGHQKNIEEWKMGKKA